MTQDVSITVTGLQMGIDEPETTIEVINVGIYSEVNNKIYLKYDELVEGESEPIHTLFKLKDDCIELVRKGPLTTNMIFKKNEKTLTYYNTPFGGIDLGIFATKVDIEKSEDCITAHTEYGLEVNGEHISDCNVRITVKPLEEGVSLC